MKRPAVLLLALLVGSTHAATFKSKAYPYTLSVPDDWQSRKVSGVDVALAAPSSGGLVPASLNVSVTPVPADLKVTLDDLRALVLKQAAESLKDFKVVSDTTLKVGGEAGRELSFTGLQQSVPMQFVQRFVLKNNVAYVITFGSSKAAYDKNRVAGYGVLDSFLLTSK